MDTNIQDELESQLLEILQDGQNLEDHEAKVTWTIRAIKALGLVMVDTRKEIKNVKTRIELLSSVFYKIMIPFWVTILGSILAVLISNLH